jgi:hypothetical protein
VEAVEMEDTPETDRFDERLAVSGVARRFGDGEGVRDGMFIKEESRSVLMFLVHQAAFAIVVSHNLDVNDGYLHSETW